MVTFLDPRSEPGAPLEPYGLAIDVLAQAPTIGLLANGFPDSEEFLDQIAVVLAEQVPAASIRRWNKRNASAIVSDDMLADIVGQCDAVVAAYGH